jgi:hypothetical protein
MNDAPVTSEAGYRVQVSAAGLPAETLALACNGLAKMIREEYPAKYTLAEIAATWGISGVAYQVTPDEVEAIDIVSEHLEVER